MVNAWWNLSRNCGEIVKSGQTSRKMDRQTWANQDSCTALQWGHNEDDTANLNIGRFPHEFYLYTCSILCTLTCPGCVCKHIPNFEPKFMITKPILWERKIEGISFIWYAILPRMCCQGFHVLCVSCCVHATLLFTQNYWYT